MATDGAKSMISKKKGVVGNYLKEIPGLISIHCICHTLSLGVRDISKTFPIFKELNNLIYKIVAYFRNSSKKLRILEDNESNLMQLDLKLINPIDCRWLSCYPAISRILDIYPAICETLKQLSSNEKDVVSKESLTNVSNFGMLLFLSENIKPAYILSKILQKENVTLDLLIDSLQNFESSLKPLENGEYFGEKIKDFLSFMKGENTIYQKYEL